MDFSIPQRVAPMLQPVRRFMRERVYPLEGLLFAGCHDELDDALEALRREVKQRGWWAPAVEAEYGGGGLTLCELAWLGAELGRSPLGHYVFNCQAPDAGNMEILALHGTEQHKQRFLRPLVAGEIRSCFSMTEPELPGSNPTWLATSARREGDSFVIDGRKWFTTAADGASFAIVMAVTEPDASRPHQRASMLIVPTDTEGFELVRNINVMGDVGAGHASHAEVRYRGCRVPATNLLGEQGAGFSIAQQRLGPGRIHHCMRWIGICERALELMCGRARTRPIAPGIMLGERQVVQHWIAEARAEIDAARLMVLRAAWMIDREGTRAARAEISTIKFYVADVLQRVLDRAIQVHGAAGLTDGTPLGYWYRHERAARIYDGPDEVHKDLVARLLLRQHDRERAARELDTGSS